MSYTRGMGSTATDIAAITTAASGAAASIISAVTGNGASSTATSSMIDPTTGMPYGAINPATGLPYGTTVPSATDDEMSFMPFVIGGLALAGVVGFLALRRSRTTPNSRRRVRRNAASKSWMVFVEGKFLKSYDYHPVTGVGDFALTSSQKDAKVFSKAEAKSIASAIHYDGEGPEARAVQKGESRRSR